MCKKDHNFWQLVKQCIAKAENDRVSWNTVCYYVCWLHKKANTRATQWTFEWCKFPLVSTMEIDGLYSWLPWLLLHYNLYISFSNWSYKLRLGLLDKCSPFPRKLCSKLKTLFGWSGRLFRLHDNVQVRTE